MQPISKETIEHADDFIFHLSDSQVKEWLDDYKKKQPKLWAACEHNASICKIKTNIDFINRVQLTVLFCFKEHDSIIPVFNMKNLKDCLDWFRGRIISLDENNTKYDSYILLGELINQEELVKYILDKIEGADENLKLSDGHNGRSFLGMCVLIIILYTQKIDDFLKQSDN